MKIIEVEKRELYMLVRVSPNLRLINKQLQNEITRAEQWCQTTQCGKRVNRHSFAFKNDAEFTMFRLKWETFD